MATWIRFEKMARAKDRKTDIWLVAPTEGNAAPIGEVKWYGSWRKYCYFPTPETVYEQVCLRDIATFCELQTAQHKRLQEASR